MHPVKKWFLLSTLCYTSIICVNANAQSSSAHISIPSTFDPYVYIGGQAGWANSNWSDFSNLSADNSGTTYGAKLGYQATRRFGVEIGGFLLPNSDLGISGLEPTGTVKSWVAYAAGTFRLPLAYDGNLFLRGKVGGAYRNLEHEGELFAGVGDGSYITAILGASLNYMFRSDTTLPIIVGIEYSNIFGSQDGWSQNGHINENGAPAAQIVTGTLSVAFKV